MPIPHVTLFMIAYDTIQAMVQRKLWASLPASAQEVYEAANRRLSQSIKSAEDPGKDNPEVAEQRRKRAALVVNAKAVSPEQARANIVAAYERQHEAGVDVLSAAIDRVKGSKTDDKAETEQVSKPTLADLLLAESEE